MCKSVHCEETLGPVSRKDARSSFAKRRGPAERSASTGPEWRGFARKGGPYLALPGLSRLAFFLWRGSLPVTYLTTASATLSTTRGSNTPGMM